jgi:hypothetical protein
VVGIAAGVALLFASQVASQTPVELGRAALPRGHRQRSVQLLARGPSIQGWATGLGQRRVWVIAPPSEASPLLPASQILEGSRAQGTARLRAGGRAVLSQALAEEHHLHIGDSVTTPTPTPTRVRVAALSTNIGWAPGAVTITAGEYARVGQRRRERIRRAAGHRHQRRARCRRDSSRAPPVPRSPSRSPATWQPASPPPVALED